MHFNHLPTALKRLNISCWSSISDLKYHQSKPTFLQRATISCQTSQVSWTAKSTVPPSRIWSNLNEDVSSVHTTVFPSLEISFRFSMRPSVSGCIGDRSKKMTDGSLRSSWHKANFLRLICDKVDNFVFLNLQEIKCSKCNIFFFYLEKSINLKICSRVRFCCSLLISKSISAAEFKASHTMTF